MAKGKRNVVVLACRSLDEAEIVKANATARSDMKRVEICAKMPRERASVYYSYHDWTDYNNWYRVGAFKLQPKEYEKS